MKAVVTWTVTPANTAHIARTAESFGFQCFIQEPQRNVRRMAKLCRSSLFSLEPLSIKRAEILSREIPFIALERGGKELVQLPPLNSIVLLVGKETGGLPKEWLALADIYTIPSIGYTRYLNAADAALIAMWELVRGDAFVAPYLSGNGGHINNGVVAKGSIPRPLVSQGSLHLNVAALVEHS